MPLLSLSKLVHKNWNNMTPAERKVAEVILHTEELAALHTASEIAVQAGVSEATVTRFCRALGLMGFGEVQEIARRSVLRRLQSSTLTRLEDSQDVGGDFAKTLSQVRATEESNRSSFYSHLNTDLLVQCARAITEARKVFCIGIRSAGPPARHLAFSLNFLRSNVFALVGDLERDLDLLMDASDDDVILVFCSRRYSKHLVGLLEAVVGSKTEIYVATDSLLSPLTKFSDKLFWVPNNSVGVVPSLTTAFVLVHALVALAGVILPESKVTRRLKRVESAYEQYGLILLHDDVFAPSFSQVSKDGHVSDHD